MSTDSDGSVAHDNNTIYHTVHNLRTSKSPLGENLNITKMSQLVVATHSITLCSLSNKLNNLKVVDSL